MTPPMYTHLRIRIHSDAQPCQEDGGKKSRVENSRWLFVVFINIW